MSSCGQFVLFTFFPSLACVNVSEWSEAMKQTRNFIVDSLSQIWTDCLNHHNRFSFTFYSNYSRSKFNKIYHGAMILKSGLVSAFILKDVCPSLPVLILNLMEATEGGKDQNIVKQCHWCFSACVIFVFHWSVTEFYFHFLTEHCSVIYWLICSWFWNNQAEWLKRKKSTRWQQNIKQ